MSPERPWLSVIVVVTTVLGGVHGIVISLRALFAFGPQGFGTSVLFGSLIIAYIYVAVAGVIFWRQPKRTAPLLWALAIQIPRISIPGLVYKFSAGFYVAVAFVAKHLSDKYSAGLNWSFNLGSSYEVRLLQDAPVEVGVNIAALAALFLLRRPISTTGVNPEEPSPKT